MSNRFSSVEAALQRQQLDIHVPSNRISEYYGVNVFNDEAMYKHLSEEAYLSVKSSIEQGTKIERAIADQVAASMKAWAISKGATHFTHWFQPLTGATAEKHDTFFNPTGNGKGIENFNGDSLVQQEPDASSFPSGGLRTTFEARGYTAWDPSSPAFIMEIGTGKTLCIPTIFVSYTGEALDYKSPLLKSIHLLETAAAGVCQYFDRNVKKVTPTLGWEQEYFLVDEALYYSRPDLVMTGRTLVGDAPAKGQQLEDFYFGSIPERVYAFMRDFETEAWKLGIPVKTRHNEVAPGQYECAPTFETMNLAVDHNQLLMDLLERVSKRHKLRVLLHEKPFAGVNGSGKHNNWSMQTDTGKNLLSPGKTPKNNLQFLTFFVNTIKAVYDHADILRASIASAGNDHRLGANEAPPAIISVFIGSQLTALLDEISQRVKHGKFNEQDKADLKIDINKQIPDVMKDNTDRNRTSPFAFTGNKFEVRAVGSSANCASSMTALNAMVGHQLLEFKKEVDELIKGGEKKDGAILRVLRRYIDHSRKILFEGDNYSKEWEAEAKKRGLSNVKTTPEALDFYQTKDAQNVFVKNKIFSKHGLEARYEIQLHTFITKVEIEALVMRDMAINQVLPAAIDYQNKLIENIKGLKEIGLNAKLANAQREIASKLSEHINSIKEGVDAMQTIMEKAGKQKNSRDKALLYAHELRDKLNYVRQHVDSLEVLADDRNWPLPKYRELLFIR